MIEPLREKIALLSSSLTTAQVSKIVLVLFIMDSPSARDPVAAYPLAIFRASAAARDARYGA